MREPDEHAGHPAGKPAAGNSGRPAKPFSPSTPADDAGSTGKPLAGIPIRRPISDAEYAQLKEDAARGKKLRRTKVQEDR